MANEPKGVLIAISGGKRGAPPPMPPGKKKRGNVAPPPPPGMDPGADPDADADQDAAAAAGNGSPNGAPAGPGGGGGEPDADDQQISPAEVGYGENDLCQDCANMGDDGSCLKYHFPVGPTGHCLAGYQPKNSGGDNDQEPAAAAPLAA